MFVLNAICDDYEDMEQISKDVFDLGARCGLTIQVSDIIEGLESLIEAGLAKAFLFDQPPPSQEIDGVPTSYGSDYLYFFITPKGRELHQEDYSPWPFDEENELRKDWRPRSN
jgi:hypothetical protein